LPPIHIKREEKAVSPLPFVDPNIEPGIPVVTTITVDRHTRFGYRASAHCLELIIGASSVEEEHSGSSLHLVIEDSPEIAAAIISLLSAGCAEVEKIGDGGEVVRWPRPRPRTVRNPRPRQPIRPSEQPGGWLTGT